MVTDDLSSCFEVEQGDCARNSSIRATGWPSLFKSRPCSIGMRVCIYHIPPCHRDPPFLPRTSRPSLAKMHLVYSSFPSYSFAPGFSLLPQLLASPFYFARPTKFLHVLARKRARMVNTCLLWHFAARCSVVSPLCARLYTRGHLPSRFFMLQQTFALKMADFLQNHFYPPTLDASNGGACLCRAILPLVVRIQIKK